MRRPVDIRRRRTDALGCPLRGVPRHRRRLVVHGRGTAGSAARSAAAREMARPRIAARRAVRSPAGADVAPPFGPYVNRNHFAGAMLLIAGGAAGGALHAAESRRFMSAALHGLTAALAAVALVATTSRGGVIGLGAVVAVLVIASGRR